MSNRIFKLAGTTPASASTATVASVGGLSQFTGFTIHAELVGATGGVLNLYLQRKIAADVWSDWIAFAQLTAGAAAIKRALDVGVGSPGTYTAAISTIGGGTDSTPAPALAAGSIVGGIPGSDVRLVAVAGASTSAGAAVAVYLIGHR